MTCDERQRVRTATLSKLIVVFQAIAIGYLALHATVSWLAYREAGVGTAVVTLLSLGFGDLYWLVRLAGNYGPTVETAVAAAASLVCFASWIARPAFNRWATETERTVLMEAAADITALTAQQNAETSGADEPRSM